MYFITVCLLALCMVYTSLAVGDVKTPTLKITNPTNNSPYNKGTLVEVHCHSETPSVQYSFTKYGIAVKPEGLVTVGPNAGLLKFVNFDPDLHKGIYQCTAALNDKKAVSGELLLGPPLKPQLENYSGYVNKGYLHMLKCTSPLATDYVMKEGNNKLSHKKEGFAKLNKYFPGGKYSCYAVNGNGGGNSETTEIKLDWLGDKSSAAKVVTSVIIVPLCVLVSSLV